MSPELLRTLLTLCTHWVNTFAKVALTPLLLSPLCPPSTPSQVRPLPPGCVTTERGMVVQQRPSSSPGSLQGSGHLSVSLSHCDSQGLQMVPLTIQEAKQLLAIVMHKVLKVPHSQKLPLLVQEGILQVRGLGRGKRQQCGVRGWGCKGGEEATV